MNNDHAMVDCTFEQHATQILAILNDAIATSTALYDYHPRNMQNMETWFETKSKANYPILGISASNGDLMGFASYGSFRNFPAYKYTVEHSVYVHKNYRGRGLSRVLMEAVINQAELQNYHVMIGCIDSTNALSIALHEKLGFTHTATMREIGFKFGRWLDAAFYQKTLSTPLDPKDG